MKDILDYYPSEIESLHEIKKIIDAAFSVTKRSLIFQNAIFLIGYSIPLTIQVFFIANEESN